jgi:hypothetical protein
MPIPLFLLKFKSENNRNPLISELSPKQKLHIIKCNMDCEDGIKRLEKTITMINGWIKSYSAQINKFKPLVDEILKESIQ